MRIGIFNDLKGSAMVNNKEALRHCVVLLSIHYVKGLCNLDF